MKPYKIVEVKLCPECGAAVRGFSDFEEHDLSTVGLFCAKKCGWLFTMEDQRCQIEQLKEKLRYTRISS